MLHMNREQQIRYNLACNAVNDLQEWIDSKYPTNAQTPMAIITVGRGGGYIDIAVNTVFGIVSLWNSDADVPESMCFNSMRLIYKAQVSQLTNVLEPK